MLINKTFVVLCGLIVAAALVVHFGGTVEPVYLTKPLAEFPQTVGKYTRVGSQDFDDEVVKAAGMDDYLMWQYRDAQGYTLGLYIGYYHDQVEGGIIHSPKHCMPGSGWEPSLMKEISVVAADGTTHKVSRMVMQKGEEKQIAHYWFQGRGRVVANEYKDRALMVWDSIFRQRSDGALVRITGPGKDDEIDSSKQVEFIGNLVPVIDNFLPQ